MKSITQGLSCNPGRAGYEPKMLNWLAAHKVSTGGIQKEWQAGSIEDRHIALLIR